MAEESPEEDLEIIDSTDLPSDPNSNINDANNPDIALDIEQQPVELVEDNMLTQFSSNSVLQSAPDLSALSDIQQEQQEEEEKTKENDTNQFIPIHDPNNITKPTDTTIHNKTKSEATGFDLFSFFQVDGDEDDDDDGDAGQDNNENEPSSKRGQSMTGLSKLDYDELNIENLRQFNSNITRDTDNESVGEINDDIDEEKEAQPIKPVLDEDDNTSLTSQHGSAHSKPDINVEQLQNQNQNQPLEHMDNVLDENDIVVEEKMDAIPTDNDIPMGIVTPSFIGNAQANQSHNSIHKIPNVLHTDNMVEYDINSDNNSPTRQVRSGTTVENSGMAMDVPMYGVPMTNMENVLEAEEDININPDLDEYNYDIEADDNDDFIAQKPQHIARRSIAEMVDAAEDLSGLGQDDDYGSDVDNAPNDHENWMETAKKWMLKEKQLKEEIMDLEDDLAKADQVARDMEIDHEKRISRMEEEKNDLTEEYDKELQNIQTDCQNQVEKLSNDNVTMARDVEVLTNGINEQKHQIDELELELKEVSENLDLRDLEWKTHQENCPLLNADLGKEVARKRKEEINALKSGSQQLDASLGKMLTENKEMEDDIKLLKEQIVTKDTQIERRNVEIDKLREELDQIKGSYNKNMGAVEELRARADEEQRQRVECEQELQKLGNEFDMLMAYSNEQSQVLDMAEFAPTGVDPEKFLAVKNKSKLFANRENGRSFVQSMGGFSEFANHMRTISDMSDALRSGAAIFSQDMKMADSTTTASEYSYASSTDIGSIASNFTRYSFRRYHTHDASREFFFLLCLCVKLSLAHKYGVSPDVAPSNENLWKQALSNNIKFHEYYDFLYNELTNLYEYKFKTSQGKIQNVVITDLSKIRHKKEQESKLKQLENTYNKQSYLYNKYEAYTKGPQSTYDKMNTIRDRTYFNQNDDIFGGNIKITTRSDRELNLQNHRSSQSSKRSSKHKKRKSKSGRHSEKKRDSKRSSQRSSHRSSHRSSRSKKDKEPGNDQDDHPLNGDPGKKRDSEKLSNLPSDNNKKKPFQLTQKSLEVLDSSENLQLSDSKKRSFHLTQKSLEVLDPSKNPSL